MLIGGVQQELPPHRYGALVGGLQEVEAAKQGGLTAARGADDGKDVPLVQGEINTLQNLHVPKALANSCDG